GRPGQHAEDRAPAPPRAPADVIREIVAGNTAANVRAAEQRFGRKMTPDDFELLTLSNARRGEKATAADYVEAQLAAFQISRALAEFMASCDVFLCATLATPPLRLGEINPMAQDLSHIGP